MTVSHSSAKANLINIKKNDVGYFKGEAQSNASNASQRRFAVNQKKLKEDQAKARPNSTLAGRIVKRVISDAP